MRKKKQGHEITVVPCRPFLVLLQSHIQIAGVVSLCLSVWIYALLPLSPPSIYKGVSFSTSTQYAVCSFGHKFVKSGKIGMLWN
jgi:hypothetical protein